MEITEGYTKRMLPRRPKNANKGTFGKILVVAGSKNLPGAAYLTCAASLRVGAGLVTLATEDFVKVIVSKQLPEVTFISYDEILEKLNKYNVLLIGPGLENFSIDMLFQKKLPKTIIDAGGLNLLAKINNWWTYLESEIILTPHPGEMAGLTGLSIKEIQANRLKIAQKYSVEWNRIIILKGANTLIVSPDGKLAISPFANPVLATAGTGDILTGIIGGMLAQGLKPFDAACASVYLHGMAGEVLSKKLGKAGVIASDILPLLPQIVKDLY